MSKVIRLSESDIERIVNRVVQEQEQTEVFGGVQDFMQGLKGVRRGGGFDNYKLLSNLSRTLKKLKKLDEPNLQVMTELRNLKTKVANTRFGSPDHQTFLNDAIDRTIQYFESYRRAVDQIDSFVSGKIS